jgi:hypothetical protein
MIYVTVLHNISDSCSVNILQVSGGQHILPYAPEYEMILHYNHQFSGKYLNRICSSLCVIIR